ASNPSFTITYNATLQSQFNSLLGGVDFQIPTLQDLVDDLGRATGIDLINQIQVVCGSPPVPCTDVGSILDPNLAIQIPLTFDLNPIKFTHHLDFGDKIGGLTLDATGDFDITVHPTFQITLGLRLAPDVPLEQRFYIADNTDLSKHEL